MAIYLDNAAINVLPLPWDKDDLIPIVRTSDGPQYKRTTAEAAKQFTDGFYAAVATDADFTLTVFTDAETIRHTGTLTADRAVTLSTTGAYAGARFRIVRTGGGAFDLNLGTGPLKALATGTWADVVYDGAAWFLAGYGAL